MDLRKCFEHDARTWLPENTIFLTRHGSHAYGTNVATSDTDYRGIVVPPKEYFFGYAQSFDEARSSAPDDVVLWGLRRYIKMAADSNPNIVEIIWTDPSDHVIVTPLGQRIIDARADFLSQRAGASFRGFAASQLKYLRKTREHGPGDIGEVRADLILRHGYDTKYAMHLVRLMRIAVEVLTTGIIHVKRQDSEELLAIRNGAWSYEQLEEWAKRMDEEIVKAALNSVLPLEPDVAKLDRLCVAIAEEFLFGTR